MKRQLVDSKHFLPAAYPASRSAESGGLELLDCRDSEDWHSVYHTCQVWTEEPELQHNCLFICAIYRPQKILYKKQCYLVYLAFFSFFETAQNTPVKYLSFLQNIAGIQYPSVNGELHQFYTLSSVCSSTLMISLGQDC